jgi:hypothetical protein
VAERKWQFKTKFRAKAFGWRGSRLAIGRLKEAFSEIKAVAKSDPVAAGDGAVSLIERIWPAFQDIDTSSGALGAAVARMLEGAIAGSMLLKKSLASPSALIRDRKERSPQLRMIVTISEP